MPTPEKDKPSKPRNLGNGIQTIEFVEKEGKFTYLTQFKSPTSRILFTGVIAKNSKIKRIEEKASKHQLKIAVMAKIPPGTKMEPSFVTINFNSYEDMVAYE